jgi:hypothetical protein
MPPDQILSTFPPASARGYFASRLPQVVLRRRTIPWERSPDLDASVGTTPTPWLALVLIAEGEGELGHDTPVGQCVGTGVDLGDDADVAKGTYLEVPKEVVERTFPTREDLSLLCHVRAVDLRDTELAMGDDDGWMAVVLGNRLPQPGGRYLACLINLEEQYDSLPAKPPEASLKLEFVRALSTLNISKVMTETYGSSAPSDNVTMGLSALPRRDVDAVTRVAGPNRAPGRLAPESTNMRVSSASGSPAITGDGWAHKAAGFAEVDGVGGLKSKKELADGFAIPPSGFFRTLRFPVLAYWSFLCEGDGDFQRLATNVHVRMLGHVVTGPETPDGDPVDAGGPPPAVATREPQSSRPLPIVAPTGHVETESRDRRGDAAPAWFRGALAPSAVPRPEAPSTPPGEPPRPLPMAHHADQLRRVVPDGRQDLGYSAAFEIGRLLALSQPGVVSALSRWRQEAFGAARVRAVVDATTAALPANVSGLLAMADHLDPDPAGGLRARTLGARAARTIAGLLGDEADALGPPRPLADRGSAMEVLPKLMEGDERITAVLSGFGLQDLVGRADADLVAGLAERGVEYAEAAPTVSSAVLRTALETAVASAAEGGARKAPVSRGPNPARARRGGAPRRDALDQLLNERGER